MKDRNYKQKCWDEHRDIVLKYGKEHEEETDERRKIKEAFFAGASIYDKTKELPKITGEMNISIDDAYLG